MPRNAHMTYKAQTEQRLRTWALLLGLWSIPGLICAAQVYFDDVVFRGRQYPLWGIFLYAIPIWWTWALATPFIVKLAERFRIERPHWGRALWVHVPASFMVTLLHLAFYAWWSRQMGMYISRPIPFWDHLLSLVGSLWFHVDFLAYWIILGGYYALDYHQKFQERELLASQLETRLAESKLRALKMQLHPHFLFNTLNAISTLVLKVDTDRALQMLNRLGDLLRVTLDEAGTQEVPLFQELAFIEQYLAIEQIRFEDRLTVEMDIAPDTLDAAVPNLILQPLVENAVRHGIAPQEAGGFIVVRAQQQKEHLRLEIEDNGSGLPAGTNPEKLNGIGLANTRTRLQQMYGDRQTFGLYDRVGGGLRVVITLPLRVVPSEQNQQNDHPVSVALEN